MASLVVAAVLFLLSRGSKGSTIPSSHRANGFCKQLDIPVHATAASAVYDLPKIDSNAEAIAWVLHEDTWSTPSYAERILKNTTTSGTFNIHAQLCVPKSSGKKKDILQIATHGAHYDSRYWDPELNREEQSYVEAALKEGYSILTYDRLGAGQSDKPDPYKTVQAPLEVEILRQITLKARNGDLYSFARGAKPNVAAFKKLEKPAKVVHVGHSFGSVVTSAFIANYGELTDGAIITGFFINQYLGKSGMASWALDNAATSSPRFDRPSGYVVCKETGIQQIFFGGDLDTAYTKEMFKYGNSIKQPVAIGELASAYQVLGRPGLSLKAPVQYMLAEFDFYVCGGDCKGVFNAAQAKAAFPNAPVIEPYVQPNTGHGFPLHNNASAGYQVTFDFLDRNVV